MVAASALLVLLLTGAAIAKPVKRGHVVLESRGEDIPSGFVNSGAASLDTMLNLRVALHQTDMSGLEKALYAVSTPSSPQYGQHLSKDEVEAYVKPTTETTNAVNAWFSSNNITPSSISPAGDWLAFSIPVSQANDLFDAEFSTFTHQATGVSGIRTLSYSVPASLQKHIDLVHPTVTFPNPTVKLPIIISPQGKPTANSTAAAPASCASSVTPSCLQDLYGIPTTLATQSSNGLAVTGLIEQYANEADLSTFLSQYRTDLPSSTTFALEEIDDGTNPQDPDDAGVEANLDTQYTVGVASGVNVTFISVGEDNQDNGLEGFLDIVNYLLGQDNPQQVLTTSYGQNEDTMSQSLAVQLCNAYMQLGARGTSILFASGDGGVSGSQSSDCTDFVPTFPSGCPYLTAVGATTGVSPEAAADFSAGGFSNYWGTPDYQSDAVSGFLTALGSTNSGLFNTSGRGYPDVSAQGQYVEIVVSGTTEQVAGTSCSSPIFASVISLLNDELIAAGKSPLGFLNPFLYSNAAALTDITSGDNPGCNTNGFSAVSGWDPVTGLGTPNYAALRTAAGL